MYCTNEKCTESTIMHQACFSQYEARLVDELAKQGKWLFHKTRFNGGSSSQKYTASLLSSLNDKIFFT